MLGIKITVVLGKAVAGGHFVNILVIISDVQSPLRASVLTR